MKKSIFIFLVMAMTILPLSASHANDAAYQLIGRELSPGIESGGIFYGALFLGKIFDQGFNSVGYFSVLLNRLDQGVEECGKTTPILSLKLFMTFKDKCRLVMFMDQNEAAALWDYDDPVCPDGRVLSGYKFYLTYLQALGGQSANCEKFGDPDVSLIAEVPQIILKKQRIGSWGMAGVSGATISGWLVHTPLIFPAVFGTVVLY